MFDESLDGLFDNVDMDTFESTGSPRGGTGASPDGLGSSEYATPEDMADPNVGPTTDFNLPRGGNAYEPGYGGDFEYGAMAGWEPEDTTPEAAVRSAGFTLLLVAMATGIGYAAKGGMGAATGLLAAGALANGYRAQKWWGSPDPGQKHEAIVSGIFSAGGLAAAGFIGYKAMQERK